MVQEVLDTECVCRGNWRALVKSMGPLIGEKYRDKNGSVYTCIGLVHGKDDYYYGMYGPAGLELLSCVWGIEDYGYELQRSDVY